MTREEREKAIDILDYLIGMVEDNQGNDYDFALKKGIEALKQEPCEDAISRKAVIKVAKDWWGKGVLAIDDIRELPSVEPIQKKGHWIITNDYLTAAYGSIDYVKCSCCGEESLEEGDYCPNCGSFMKGEFE